jgi:hypothetical protein
MNVYFVIALVLAGLYLLAIVALIVLLYRDRTREED